MPNRIAPRSAFDAQTHDAGKPPSKEAPPKKTPESEAERKEAGFSVKEWYAKPKPPKNPGGYTPGGLH
jgi:hypothetical protein